MGDMKIPGGIQPDVLNRELPKVGDQQLKREGSLEGDLIRGAGRNVVAVGEDAVNVVLDVANIGYGAGQVVGGALGALKNLFDAGVHRLPDVKGALDKQVADLEAKGELPAHEKLSLERMKMVRANLDQISEKNWPMVKEGLLRIASGAGFAVVDLASMPVDAAQAVIEVALSAGVVLTKGIVGAGTAIGTGLYHAGVAIKDGAVWAGGKAWDGIVWTGGKIEDGAVYVGGKIADGAVAVKDGVIWAGGKVADGAVAVKDGAVWVGGKLADSASWIGNAIREGYEDSMAAIGRGAISQANKAANGAPRFILTPLKDVPAHE